MASKDFTSIPNTTANEIQETITTHNILVTILTAHYIKKYEKGLNIQYDYYDIEKPQDRTETPKFHRTFGMLLLHLTQCPDLTFEELNNLISCGKYQLPPSLIKTFHLEVHRVINSDVDGIIDTFKSIEEFLDNGLPRVHQLRVINGSSPIGIFLRRGVVFFDKMLFLQIEAVMKEVKNNCKMLNELLVIIIINNTVC